MYSIEGADGATYGPVELRDLIQWARDGRVVARTPVIDHTSGRRFLACDLAELNAVFQGAAAPAPVVDLRPAVVRPPGRPSRRACPRCGGRRISRSAGSQTRFSYFCCSCLMAPMLLPLVFFLPGTRRTCLECGLEW